MKGFLTSVPNRRLKILLILQALWLGTICLLGAWWAKTALKQANRIAELEEMLGIPATETVLAWKKTQRMLFWESTTFFILLIAITCFMFWVYWRDLKRSRSLHGFFASVTHELRTPLTNIKIQLGNLAEDVNHKLIDRLLEDVSKLETQVERTLELARVESGGPVFTQAFPIRLWVERFTSFFSDLDRLEIINEIRDFKVLGEASSVQVILKNLLENSVRHNRGNSVRVSLSSERKNNWIILHYRDDGEGFSGDQNDLGNLFFRSEKSSGSGVGLYLVRALMRRMGGDAKFDGRNGFHASLWFREGL